LNIVVDILPTRPASLMQPPQSPGHSGRETLPMPIRGLGSPIHSTEKRYSPVSHTLKHHPCRLDRHAPRSSEDNSIQNIIDDLVRRLKHRGRETTEEGGGEDRNSEIEYDEGGI
jgi:hypothetical protein